MANRTAEAVWNGDLKSGSGGFKTPNNAVQGKYTFGTRFGDEQGTNPEQLIAAAHAGCFSMALAHTLAQAGHTPDQISTKANVSLVQKGEDFTIPTIELTTEGKVPGIDEATFLKYAEMAKKNCPVSKLVAAAEIKLNAKLVS